MAQPLDLTQFLQGSGSLVYVSISIIIGLIIISKYFKYKKMTFLLVGIAWTGMAIPWLGDVINFISYLAGAPYLPDEAYLIIVVAFLPLFVFLWLVALSDLLHLEKKNLILIITLISSVIIEVLFFVILFADISSIGTQITPFQYQFSDWISVYMLIVIFVVLATGLDFAYESIKSDDKAIKLKGKLLIIAFVSFITGALLDSQLELTEITVVFVRIILISSSILFYLGFILPDWARKLLLKEE